MIRYISQKFSALGDRPMTFFKVGATVVLAALCAICALCHDEAAIGGVGLELYYAPMLDYILTAFLIFWGGMFLLDLAEKELSAGK